MEGEYGGKRPNSGRKRKKIDPKLQDALKEAIPHEKWVSIWKNIAEVADQCEDKRAAIMAARELRPLRSTENTAPTPTAPPLAPPSRSNEPEPPLFVYEHYNDGLHRDPDKIADWERVYFAVETARAEKIMIQSQNPPRPMVLSKDVCAWNGGMPRQWADLTVGGHVKSEGKKTTLAPFAKPLTLPPAPAMRFNYAHYGRAAIT